MDKMINKKYIRDSLKDLYPEGEINSMIQLIFEKVCGLSLNRQLLEPDRQLSNSENERIAGIVERLKRMEPLQYILGETEFYSIPVKLNSFVLIPRPETEELADMIIKSDFVKNYRKKNPVRIMDIGAGSGCVSVTLAKNIPRSIITAADIDVNALLTTYRNTKEHHLSNIKITELNILREKEWKDLPERFEIIVSNPPYVLNSEKETMSDNVLKYEPHRALFVPDSNPLKFYKAIADFAVMKLLKNGLLFLEINPLCAEKIHRLLLKKGFGKVEIKKDLSGKDRFVTAKK